VPLEGIFTDVFILDKPSAFRYFDIMQLHEDPEKLRAWESERKNGLKIVQQIENNRLFILGKPGAGKTTFLKYLTLQAVQSKLHKISIFVSLHEWSNSGLDLMPFLVKQFEICHFPNAQAFIEHILTTGDAIVLFDGLDEVKQEGDKRSQIIDMLKNFSKQYLSTQILITCRIAATDYFFEQFTYMEVADFTEEQMRIYAENWFKNNPEKKQAFFQEWEKSEHENLRDLSKIPLLLSLLCLTFDETLNFPTQRAKIYKEILNVLLKKWDSSRNIQRNYQDLLPEKKQKLFTEIAVETFENQKYFIDQEYLSKKIEVFFDSKVDGESVLKAIESQHGIFVERARGIYSFSHLTFQEYFTAKYIADNAEPSIFKQLIGNCLKEYRWHEVLLLTVSLLDDADEFFNIFRQMIDNIIKNDEKLVQFIQWSAEKANTVDTPYKPETVRSIYNFLVLSTELAFDYEHKLESFFTPLNNVFDFYNTLALASALDEQDGISAPDFDFIRDVNTVFDLKIDFSLVFIQQFALIFFTGQGHQTTFKENKRKFSIYFKEIVDLYQQKNLTELHHALSSLTIPNVNNSKEALVIFTEYKEWAVFAEDLRKIMQTHRNIGHEWNFTTEQLKLLRRYFEANQLLVECLNLAVVSDRAGIENSLLLPPSNYDTN